MPIYTGELSLQDAFDDESFWADLYALLLKRVRPWVYNTKMVPTWKYQEQEVAEDIVATAIEKILKSLNAARQRGEVIFSIERWSIKIARHCFLDLIRRESRLLHFSYDMTEFEEQQHALPLSFVVDPSQEVEEKIYEEWALAASAETIAAFSKKLREAILADLANNSHFAAEPSVLEQAFLVAGIHLQDYQRAPSPDAAERGRQSALRSLGYKRLAQAHIG